MMLNASRKSMLSLRCSMVRMSNPGVMRLLGCQQLAVGPGSSPFLMGVTPRCGYKTENSQSSHIEEARAVGKDGVYETESAATDAKEAQKKYNIVEENEVEVLGQHQDDMLFEILTRSRSVEQLTKLYRQDQAVEQQMTSFHQAVFLSRLVKYLKAEELQQSASAESDAAAPGISKEADSVYQDVVGKLLEKLPSLEHESLLHLMTALSQQLTLKSVTPVMMRSAHLSTVETLVLDNFFAFLNSDLTIPIAAIIQHGGMPTQIIAKLDKMIALSIFGKPQVLRLMEILVDSNQTYENQKLFEKLLVQLERLRPNLTDRETTKALQIISQLMWQRREQLDVIQRNLADSKTKHTQVLEETYRRQAQTLARSKLEISQDSSNDQLDQNTRHRLYLEERDQFNELVAHDGTPTPALTDDQSKFATFIKFNTEKLIGDAQALVDHYISALQLNHSFSATNIKWTHIYVNSITRTLERLLSPGHYDDIGSVKRSFTNVDKGELATTAPMLDTFYLMKYTGQKVTDNVMSMGPKELLTMLRLFSSDENVSKLLTQKTLDGFKHHQLDIRLFNFGQLAKLISHVSVHQPKDMKVFFNYIEMAFTTGYYRVSPRNFQPMTDIFYLFVKQGFLTPWIEDKFSLNYILQLKYEMFPKNKNIQELPARDLIKIAWSLVVMQKPGKISNPMLPNVLMQLHKFDRPNKPLTTEELIMLYQVDVFVKDMVRRKLVPQGLKEILPEKVKATATKVYREWESQPVYERELDQISQILIKLRARFTRDTQPFDEHVTEQFPGMNTLNSYTVPIRIDGKEHGSHLILVKGPHNANEVNGSWTGLNMVKANLLRDTDFARHVHVTTIDVADWNGMQEEQQIRYLYDVLHEGETDLRLKRAKKVKM